ncbi:MAG: hypothetical protein PVF49_02930 [Anaerolineales bacterium]|jgi:hypothetical protein
MKRNQFVSLILGLALGIGAGLLYSWGVNPVQVIDTVPSALRPDYKQDYLILIASAYQSSGDLDRARSRLAAVGLENPASDLNRLSQALIEQDSAQTEAGALAELALALQNGASLPAGSATPTRAATLAASVTPSASPTITRTPTIPPTPAQPFQLVSQELVCDPTLTEPLIQIIVLDAADNPISGVEIQVVWDSGQSRFFTGLKPELGLGYADFTMSAGTTYTLQVADSESPINDIRPEECTSGGGTPSLGSWLFVFQHPDQN